MYCRKSTESKEQQALSIPAQIRENTEFAERLVINGEKVRIVETVTESRSASIPNNRPDFDRTINMIKKGEADGYLVWKPNRLSRNWLETGNLLQLLNDNIIKVIATPEKLITRDNSNDILLGVEFGEASQYSKNLSKDVKRGIREKIDRGDYPNKAPVFYKNIGTSKLNKSIEPDPQTSQYFEEWIDFIIEYKPSIREATDWLNDRGLRTKRGHKFVKSGVHRMLQNPVYCGILKYGNFPARKGNWKPLISVQKYNTVQDILSIKKRQINYTHEIGYKNLILCGHCGCAITCSHKIKNSRDYIYYHCTKKRGNCPQPYTTEMQLEDQLYDFVTKVSISKELRDECIEVIREEYKDKFKFYKRKESSYREKTDEIDVKLDRLMQKLLNDVITDAEYKREKESLLKQKAAVGELSGDNEFNYELWIEKLENFFETCFNVEQVFLRGTIQERTALVKSLGQNLKMYNGELSWNFQNHWLAIASGEKSTERSVVLGD